MPRPKSLELARIAEAALAVVDREGSAALSMRAVATELGVGTMTLYRYVQSREEIEIAVVDRVLEAVAVETSSRAKWTTRVRAVLEDARSAVAAHPNVIPLLVSVGTTQSGALLRCGEAVLSSLASAGFEPRARAVAFRTLIAYLIGAVQVEHYGPVAGPRTNRLAAQPQHSHPALAETASSALGLSGDEVFRRGLTIVLRGLSAKG